MVEEKDKHECNKKLIDEGNEEEEQESKIFLKKGIIRRISQLSEWNVWWIEGTVRLGESRGSDKQPNGILSSRCHGSLAKRLKERVNEKSLCPRG